MKKNWGQANLASWVVTPHDQIGLMEFCATPCSRQEMEMMEFMGLIDRKHFTERYLKPLLASSIIFTDFNITHQTIKAIKGKPIPEVPMKKHHEEKTQITVTTVFVGEGQGHVLRCDHPEIFALPGAKKASKTGDK